MLEITQRLGHIFTNLRDSVAAQSAFRRMTGLLIIRIYAQLHWIERRLCRAIARAAAGEPPRPSRTRQAPKAGTTTAPSVRKLPLPRREGWLIPLMPPIVPARHVAAAYGSQLRAVLQDPAMAPYLAYPSVVRQLRPICRMLGITDALPPPTPRPAPPSIQTPPETTSRFETTSSSARHAGTVTPPVARPQPTAPAPRPVRRIPPRRLKLPLPYPS